MDKSAFLLLINKFLAGDATPEEEQALFNYYQSFQQSAEWNNEELGDVHEAQERLLKKIHTSISLTEQSVYKARTRRLSFVRFAAAAVLILAIVGFLMKDIISSWLHPVQMLQASTGMMEHRLIRLPDSSQVWLEPMSEIKYPVAFNGTRREISLKGGAFFEVSHNPQKPFIIHTNLISTQVLGTSFNVQAYDNASAAVVVITGKVLVSTEQNDKTSEGKQVTLTPDQRAIFNSSSGILLKEAYPAAKDYTQRRFGKLIYKGMRVSDVIKDLQHFFNTPISLQGNLSNCTFYGDFNVEQGIEKTLNLLAVTINATYKKDPSGSGYILSGAGCQ